MAQDFNPDTLYYGDCLDWMREWESDCVDLIYLDPPFNSNANYNVLFSDKGDGKAQYRAFSDTWSWDAAAAKRYAEFENAPGRLAHDAIVGLRRILGRSGMLAYLTYMAERLEEMRRILKPTGSIYLHCDSTASHYLKTVMDAIFDRRNFRNEIVWNRSAENLSRKKWRRASETLFYYTKGKTWTWNPQYDPLNPRQVERDYRFEDERGRYTTTSCTNNAHRPNMVYEFHGNVRQWRYSKETMLKYEREGLLVFNDKGIPRRKRYLADVPGRLMTNVWSDINVLTANQRERLGYPTQKPLALLNRIIEASSNEGDIVLDPFCGCGTAVEAARRLNRRWAGVDISSFAIDLVQQRLQDESIPVKGIPADLESARKLAREKPFEFESWAVTRLPGFAPNTKQVADGGVDGRGMLYDEPDDWDSRLALAQVKGGKFTAGALRDFIGVINSDEAAIGRFITLDPVASATAKSNAVEQGTIVVRGQSYQRLLLWSMDDYFNNRPCPLPPMTNPYTGKRMQQGLF